MSATSSGCLCAHVRISLHTDVVAPRAKEVSFRFIPVCSLSFCLRRMFCMSVHQSDKVSVCMRMKDPARQIKRKRKRQIGGKKIPHYSCLPVCLHLFICCCCFFLFVSFQSVCHLHCKQSILMAVFFDTKCDIMCHMCIAVFRRLA